MRYALYDLSPTQFENFVIDICRELLGSGVQSFSSGKDAGIDGKFVGVANDFPSKNSPLTGTTIIQAKHSSNPGAKFSDTTFGGDSETSIISIEIPKIKKLYDDAGLDSYLLFSNRRLGAIIDNQIVERIKKETGVSYVRLFGSEEIEQYVKRYPTLANSLDDYALCSPLRPSPDDIAEVITAIAEKQAEFDLSESYVPSDLKRVEFTHKNELNGLSEEYARHITDNFLKHFTFIDDFLEDPDNSHISKLYEDAIHDFSSKLIVFRKKLATYDEVLNKLIEDIIERDTDLKKNKRLTRTLVYFMYWECDIGTTAEESDASSN